MEITPTTLFLVGFISVVLGFLASSLLSTLREDGAEPIPDENLTPPGGQKGRYTPIFRLWRERDNGKLVVEIDGKSLVDRSALNDPQREKIEEAARDLRSWLGMGLAQHSAPRTERGMGSAGITYESSVSGAAPTIESGGEDAKIHQDVSQLDKGSSSQPYAVHGGQAAPAAHKPVNAKPAESPVESPPGPKSIVMQIEDILQDMISGTPLEQRDIHLSEDPARGVIVTVGIDHFEGIDSVPDAAVKDVIRQAVAEWEQSQ